MSERLTKQIQFLIEVDKLKLILRQTKLLCDQDRQENDAEHSWHLAMYVIILKEYANKPDIDWFKVIKMVVIHDLVEIYAGDTFLYDENAAKDKQVRELVAADKLFALLPEDQGNEICQLWEEFEKRETSEARFAAVVDRLQPFIHNFYTSDGGTWRRPAITKTKVMNTLSVITENSKQLGEFIHKAIIEAVETAKLREDEPVV